MCALKIPQILTTHHYYNRRGYLAPILGVAKMLHPLILYNSLLYQIYKHLIKNNILLLYTGCSFLAKSAVKIKDHCRTHTGERQLACPSCGAFFSNKTKFIDHLTRQNEKLCKSLIGNISKFCSRAEAHLFCSHFSSPFHLLPSSAPISPAHFSCSHFSCSHFSSSFLQLPSSAACNLSILVYANSKIANYDICKQHKKLCSFQSQ